MGSGYYISNRHYPVDWLMASEAMCNWLMYEMRIVDPGEIRAYLYAAERRPPRFHSGRMGDFDLKKIAAYKDRVLARPNIYVYRHGSVLCPCNLANVTAQELADMGWRAVHQDDRTLYGTDSSSN